MRRIILAASVSAVMISAVTAASAAPVAVQNRETGNIEIRGIGESSVTVQVLYPEYTEGAEVTKSDIVNFVYADTVDGAVTVPVKIEKDGMYTIRVNGRISDELWQTDLQCYNTETLGDIVEVISSGTEEEIYEFFEEKENRTKLGADEAAYTAMTATGRKAWAAEVAESDISDISDYTDLYNEAFPYYATVYAKDGRFAAEALEKFDIADKNVLGYDDYNAGGASFRQSVGEYIIENAEPDKDDFEKSFSEGVFLAKIADTEGGADVNPIMKKYRALLSSDADKYYKRTDTYSVDSKIAGESFKSVAALEKKLSDIISGKGNSTDNGGSRPSGGGSSGGSGGGVKHIEATGLDVSADEKIFCDLDSVQWAEEAILGLNKAGIAEGDGTGCFRPLDNITREEFVKLLTLAFDEVSGDGELPFADADSGEWYYTYILSGYSKGLIKGVTEDRFGVGVNITRQDMAVLTYRYMTYAGVNLEQGDILAFYDKAQIGDYALESVYALNHNGIVKGMEDGSFRPLSNSTRAEAAQIIYNALVYSGRYR